MPARTRDLTPDRSARHLFGSELRRLREDKGYTLEQMAVALASSKSSLARYETAESMIPPDLPTSLDTLLETGGLFVRLYGLAKKEIHPDQFRRRMELEERAVLFQEYTGQIISGLVQTPAFARAQFILANPKATAEQVDELVTARLSRQERFGPASVNDLALVLDEAAIRRPFGSQAVIRDQLEHLRQLTLTPSTTIQVLPFAHGGHALMGGTLTLMVLDDGSRVAYEESISTGTLIEDRLAVQERQRSYDLLRASALSPQESGEFLKNILKEYG
ncbi:helix-turn-helix domain-containing protein [Streptomyces sp. XM4193]|uniref:helix-turn-helix domain-containing protein n=1 Tax=Streptomyces sp. XM4193 TaxID=2929782 RepID=UPI001FFABEF8|nr:helix-turn-helix transcriptional regulator [Streptomyces sp. XM4193]MCK1794494.1 helix-turn-helix domain-containing protein [Streptomyces sp. XM4193]